MIILKGKEKKKRKWKERSGRVEGKKRVEIEEGKIEVKLKNKQSKNSRLTNTQTNEQTRKGKR